MIQSLETNSSLFSSTTTECLLLRRVSFENSHIWVQCVILPFVLCVIKNVDVLIKLCWENSRWLSISALPQRFSLLRKIAESIQRCQFCFMRRNTLDPSNKRSCTEQNLLPTVQVFSFKCWTLSQSVITEIGVISLNRNISNFSGFSPGMLSHLGFSQCMQTRVSRRVMCALLENTVQVFLEL